jgi:hypothetical protein
MQRNCNAMQHKIQISDPRNSLPRSAPPKATILRNEAGPPSADRPMQHHATCPPNPPPPRNPSANPLFSWRSWRYLCALARNKCNAMQHKIQISHPCNSPPRSETNPNPPPQPCNTMQHTRPTRHRRAVLFKPFVFLALSAVPLRLGAKPSATNATMPSPAPYYNGLRQVPQ